MVDSAVRICLQTIRDRLGVRRQPGATVGSATSGPAQRACSRWRSQRAIALLAALICVFAVAASPALAAGSSQSSSSSTPTDGSSLGSLGYGSTTATSTGGDTISVPKTASSTTGDNISGGFSSSDAIVIVAVVVILFCGIVGYIWYDARRRAPKGSRDGELNRGSHSGSKSPRKSRKLSPAERKRRRQGRAPTKRRK